MGGGRKQRLRGDPTAPPRKRSRRALTDMLRAAGEEHTRDHLGRKRTRAETLTALVWQLVTTGVVELPGSEATEPRVLTAGLRDWKDAVAWLLTQIDGPARLDVSVETGTAGTIAGMTDAELMAAAAAAGVVLTPEEAEEVDA